MLRLVIWITDTQINYYLLPLRIILYIIWNYYFCKEESFFFFYDTLNKFQLLLKDGKEKQTFTNPSPNLALHKIKSYT